MLRLTRIHAATLAVLVGGATPAPVRAQAPDSFAIELSVGRRQPDGRHFWVFLRFARPGGVVVRRDSLSSACLYERLPASDSEAPALDSAQVVRRIPSLLRWSRWGDLGVDREPSDGSLAFALAGLLGPDGTFSSTDLDALRAELREADPPVVEIRCIALIRSFVWSSSRDALLMWPTLRMVPGR